MKLPPDLRLLMPDAIEWAVREARAGGERGFALTPDLEAIARSVGVGRPESIRVAVLEQLPFPDHPALQAAALQMGLLGPDMIGLTLGHTVFIRRGGERSIRLLSHEFRHVQQYEAAGSIAAFLPGYLRSIVAFGYENSPYEVDARAHQIDDA